MIPECKILIGDVREQLGTLPADSVQCVVTSPPYWALRDYGTTPQTWGTGWVGEVGLEPTPDLHVAHQVEVFREIHRVLKPDGTCWMNFGDSYAGASGGYQGKNGQRASRTFTARIGVEKSGDGLKPKDLVGMPWRVAFALQADGWWLRQEIIWSKPNPMPESISDRCTKSHEHIFLLTKSARYFFDAEAIKEPVSGGSHARGHGVNPKSTGVGWGYVDDDKPRARRAVHGWATEGSDRSAITKNRGPRAKQNASFSAAVANVVENRNKRSVWTVPTAPYSEAHYATFPPDLIRPCILAGSRHGDTVLDPFGGSGTTGAVALEYGRNAVLIDLNPANEALMRGRLAPVAGQGVMPMEGVA
jgi:DNA modification methylase